MRLPWRRNQTDETTLPKEVQDYYQAEKRQRVGVASLLAVGTLIATVVLAVGIFFGGRWVWRHTVNRPKTGDTASVQAPDDKTSSSTVKTNSGSSTLGTPGSNSGTSGSQTGSSASGGSSS